MCCISITVQFGTASWMMMPGLPDRFSRLSIRLVADQSVTAPPIATSEQRRLSLNRPSGANLVCTSDGRSLKWPASLIRPAQQYLKDPRHCPGSSAPADGGRSPC